MKARVCVARQANPHAIFHASTRKYLAIGLTAPARLKGMAVDFDELVLPRRFLHHRIDVHGKSRIARMPQNIHMRVLERAAERCRVLFHRARLDHDIVHRSDEKIHH